MVRQTSNIVGTVEVWTSGFAELILTVSVHQHPLRWDTLEAGKAGLQAIERGMSAELREVLAELDLTGRRVVAWGALLAWAWRRRLNGATAGAAAVADAGDEDVATWQAPLAEAERRETDWFRSRLARALSIWNRDLFAADETAFIAAMAADAEAKRRLAAELPADQVVELATNGVVWQPSPAVAHAVVIPSAVVRPWVIHEEAGDTVLFAYPAAEVSGSDAAGEARARQIVRLARVLADESRMAALRLLAERTWTLQELADELGLRKSTMHHHLAQLRAAGLLRVPYGSKSYSLRRQPLEDLGAALGGFGRDV